MNPIVDMFRTWLHDYWEALPVLLVVVVVTLVVMGFQRVVRSSVKRELDERDQR